MSGDVAPDSSRPDEGRRAHAKPDEVRAGEARELFERLRAGDTSVREPLTERFLPLARQLARRYQRANEPLDDLIQVASVGLVKAVDRFDPERGVAFSSYAVPTILGELKRYFRDAGWAVHVPRGAQEQAMRVDRSVKELSTTLGRSPTVPELAAESGMDEEEVLAAMQASMAYEAVSMDAQRPSADAEGDSFADSMGEED